MRADSIRTREYIRTSIPFFLPILVVGVIYLITLALLPKQYFWIADNDNKFLQLEAIISSGYADYSIPWPGVALDPEFTFNPLPSPFSQVSGGRLYSIFSPVFATVSTIPYRLFGFTGLYLLPLAGSLLLLWGVFSVGRAAGFDDRASHAAVLVTGLCTPVWFYSVLFWEHTIAVACCVWTVYFLFRFTGNRSFRTLAVMSVLAALGVYFRDELYLFCLVVSLTAGYLYPGRRLRTFFITAGIMLGAVVPLWFFQGWSIGRPFGFHLGEHLFSVSGITEHLAARPQVVYNLFLAALPNTALSVLISAPLIAFLLVPGRFLRGFGWTAVPIALGGLVLAAVSLGGYIVTESPIAWLLQSNSLLPASPVLVLAATSFRPDGAAHKTGGSSPIRLIATLYLLIYALAAPAMGSTGIHWGNRFVLVLYPLLALLAVEYGMSWARPAGRRKPLAAMLVGLLLIISFTAQVYSCTLIARKKDFNRRLTETVATRPEEAVVTDVWWVPQALSYIFYEKQLFYVPSPVLLQDLGRRLIDHGITDVLFITTTSVHPPTGDTTRVDDNGLGFFSLDMMHLELRTGDR
ncbi:hypothetical protein ACFL5H_01025 [Candidatus Latescibacterota bacterium]